MYAVVGGGWAGLAAASALISAGNNVHLFEMAPQLGGRARNAQFKPDHPLPLDEVLQVDNGQHLLMGAYSSTIELCLKLAGAPRFAAMFERMPVTLNNHAGLRIQAARHLPAPLHLGWALISAEGLSIGERVAMVLLLKQLKKRRWLISEADISVSELLNQCRQPAKLIAQLWRPLCLSALNTPLDSASAKVFAVILRDTLAAKAASSDFLVANVPLGDTLPKLVNEQLSKPDNAVFLSSQVLAIHQPQTNQRQFFVQTQGNRSATAYSGVVLATPWFTTQALLNRSHRTELAQLPIVTLYLYWRHSAASTRQRPIMLLDDPNKQYFAQWLFDLGNTRGGGRLASVVISGPGSHLSLDRQTLAAAVSKQINDQLGWIAPDDNLVITEKRATFACTVGLERPHAEHDLLDGVALCGDYFQSDYPATLETAVRSGLAAAKRLLIFAE
jgi:hydroxysqualene dehydroxylase